MLEAKVASLDDVREFFENFPHGTMVNVLPEEQYKRRHIPGSKQACVFETAFLENMRELAPDHTEAVLVYGAGNSMDASAAASKLLEAGYGDVWVFDGGIDEWREAGLPLEGSATKISDPDYPPILPQYSDYELIPEESALRWTGRNDGTAHWGALPLKGGSIHFVNPGANGSVSGSVVADMLGITCDDLTEETNMKLLLAHLASSDFFSTRVFPEASLSVQELKPLAGAGHNLPNFYGKAMLKIRGHEQLVEGDLSVRNLPEKKLSISGLVSLDRTRWGVLYGSAKLFRFLGMHKVDDLITLDARLIYRAVEKHKSPRTEKGAS